MIVPQVHWAQSTETVLTLKWIEGVNLTQAALSEPLRREVAALVVQMMMQQILLDRFFHADPHPGNLLYVGDGTNAGIALLSFTNSLSALPKRLANSALASSKWLFLSL